MFGTNKSTTKFKRAGIVQRTQKKLRNLSKLRRKHGAWQHKDQTFTKKQMKRGY